jgi:hypothetical protein
VKIFCCLAILLICLFSDAQAQSTSTTTLDRIVRQLAKTGAVGVVGWESLPDAREALADSDSLRYAVAQSNLSQLAKIITDETDYQCQIGKGYFLIFPKENRAVHDLPLSMRKVSFPESKNLPYNQLLMQIKSTSEPRFGAFICNSAPYMGQILDDPITLQAGHGECLEVLNEIARQLKATYWIMTHMVLLGADGKKTKLPMKLNVGIISYFAKSR